MSHSHTILKDILSFICHCHLKSHIAFLRDYRSVKKIVNNK
jgi:hypothetical protein